MKTTLIMLAVLSVTSLAKADTIGYTGAVVDYTVTATGFYDITAAGAQGGGGIAFATGGLGAVLSGDVFLTAGTELGIVAGGSGASGDFGGKWGGGGGGGSFVYVLGAPQPLIVAGGGGGSGFAGNAPFELGGEGQTGTAGLTGGGPGNGAGGTAGAGGGGGTGFDGQQNGGGGGGWAGNGGDGLGTGPFSGEGGSGDGGFGAFTFLGGQGGVEDGSAADGGFGGGGGGGYQGGGGGGGYSGGGGGDGDGYGAGGGGSYFDASVSDISAMAGEQAGDGYVTINAVGTTVTPEPNSFVLLGTGLAAFAGGMRRRFVRGRRG